MGQLAARYHEPAPGRARKDRGVRREPETMKNPRMPGASRDAVARRAKSIFGIAEEVGLNLIDRLEGCQICGGAFKGQEPYLDHDHGTGALRGFLCRRCNYVLGFAGDDTAVLLHAIEYLTNPPVDASATRRRKLRKKKKVKRRAEPEPKYSPFFERLNSARILNGSTPREACEAMRVSVPTWYKWRHGAEPRNLQRTAAEAYIGTAVS